MHASDIHIISRRGRMTRRATQAQPVRKKGDKVTGRDNDKEIYLFHFQKMQLICTQSIILRNDSDYRTLK